MNGYFVRPESRGTVRLSSADPDASPRIDPNYFADRRDEDMTVKAVQLMREIAAQPALAKMGAGEILPGPQVKTDKDVREFIRAHSRTAYHAVGTRRMGQDDDAVVDPMLRVRGVTGLRVCDSSIMPRLISSNTNAAVIMIAEKASDLILGREGGQP